MTSYPKSQRGKEKSTTEVRPTERGLCVVEVASFHLLALFSTCMETFAPHEAIPRAHFCKKRRMPFEILMHPNSNAGNNDAA